MAGLVFVLLCIAGAFVFAMRQAPLWGWAAALAAAVLAWRTASSTAIGMSRRSISLAS